ncbi:hypothetical protein FB451DRAFT_1358691 [Mycena latifolia]|nr:hypothetical protein FB451DRAFT_1358691 [Mycena latifolia]
MPKASKSKKARQDNLSKATAALTLKRSQTSTLIPEELAQIPLELDSPAQTFSELDLASLDDTLSSWDLLLGDELPDVECTELQENNADEEDMELNSAAALDSLGEFLVNAQKAAEKAELLLEQETGRKRKRGIYTGHSKQTLWRQKKAQVEESGLLWKPSWILLIWLMFISRNCFKQFLTILLQPTTVLRVLLRMH